MNRFNSLFNTMQMTRGASPFAIAGGSTINSAISRGGLLSKLGGGKMSLSGILTGAQKTIGTVNQIIPLYNQIKPMVQNSKVLLNVAKGIKGDGTSKGLFGLRKRNRNYYPNNDEKTIDIKQEERKEIKKENQNSPSKPYFI